MATSLAPSAARNIARTSPFRLGRKEIYLPDFTITLARTRLPPQYATFIVPLAMNKLDLRDYLWHAYAIRTLGITSRILPSKVQESRPGVERPVKTLFRPAPTKKMTVLMEKAFVWPAAPAEEVLQEQFNRDQFRAAEIEQEKAQEKLRARDTWVDKDERSAMREQARRLLLGKDQWRTPGRGEGSWAVRKQGTEVGVAPEREQGGKKAVL